MNDDAPKDPNEPHLSTLRAMPIPAPRAEKRAQALAAAMAAFEATKSEARPKGIIEPLRPSLREERPALGQSRRQHMQNIDRKSLKWTTRGIMQMAASVAAVALIAPLALQLGVGSKLENHFNNVSAQLDGRSSSNYAPAPRKQTEMEYAAHPPLADAKQDQTATAVAPAPAGAPDAATSWGLTQMRTHPLAPNRDVALALRTDQSWGSAQQSNRVGNDTGNALYAPPEAAPMSAIDENRDRFANAQANPIKLVTQEPVSTFSIDVDTASYSFARRALNAGRLPQKAAVRIEEMVNYFDYAYPRPDSADQPLRPTVTVMPSPWNGGNQIIHIGIKSYELTPLQRPRANLVFLVDISGSMQPEDRLPLLKNAFRMLVDKLQPEDVVSIVTYAAGSDLRLPPTTVAQKDRIIAAIDSLNANGSTNGAQGITDAYRVAEANFDKTGVNRIILATDGDFNVGITDQNELQAFIERKRDSGIYLSVLGVGKGNHNDAMMQALAQNGNGTAAYIDTLNEARKVLVDEASSTLFPIANDVKIQLEFNPAAVSSYRLIGYETRALKREDFNNDKVDAGDTGSGHAVTAIYEITPVGSAQKIVDDLRYATPSANAPAPDADNGGELAFLKIRYKLPKEQTSRLMTQPILRVAAFPEVGDAPQESRFAAAVAGFGQLLAGSPYLKNFGYDDVIALADGAKGKDEFGYRAEFVNLVRLAKTARP